MSGVEVAVAKELLNYGVLGAVVIGMAAYIYFLHRQHSKEREEWKKTADRFNDTVKDNMGVIHEIRGMLTRK